MRRFDIVINNRRCHADATQADFERRATKSLPKCHHIERSEIFTDGRMKVLKQEMLHFVQHDDRFLAGDASVASFIQHDDKTK